MGDRLRLDEYDAKGPIDRQGFEYRIRLREAVNGLVEGNDKALRKLGPISEANAKVAKDIVKTFPPGKKETSIPAALAAINQAEDNGLERNLGNALRSVYLERVETENDQGGKVEMAKQIEAIVQALRNAAKDEDRQHLMSVGIDLEQAARAVNLLKKLAIFTDDASRLSTITDFEGRLGGPNSMLVAALKSYYGIAEVPSNLVVGEVVNSQREISKPERDLIDKLLKLHTYQAIMNLLGELKYSGLVIGDKPCGNWGRLVQRSSGIGDVDYKIYDQFPALKQKLIQIDSGIA